MKLLMLNDPILRQVCEPVTLEELGVIKSYLPAMTEILLKEEGAALAANQVGITKRFFLLKDGTLVINPIILHIGALQPFEEGCLSIPGVHAQTERALSLKLQYKDENFSDVEKDFTGVDAVAIQHEIDHLDGILYIDQLKPMRKQLVVEKHRKYLKMKGRS